MHISRFAVLICSALLYFVSLTPARAAEIPRTISFQGVLKDAVGKPVTAPTIVTFRLYDAETAGNAVWTETKAITPDASGVFATSLGSATPMASVVFDKACWVGIKVGTDAEMTPRLPLQSAPYALYSPTASELRLPYRGTASDANNILSITNTGSGDGIVGVAARDSTSIAGVKGIATVGHGVGVYGIATMDHGNAVVGRADGGPGGWGVWGISATGVGVIGQSTSGLAAEFDGTTYVNGRLGIGTKAPVSPLTVKAESWLDLIDTSGNVWWNFSNQNGALQIVNVYQGDLLYFKDGKLGIGTKTPDRPLTLQGTDWASFKDTSGTTKWSFANKNGGLNVAETGVRDGRLYLQPGGNVGLSQLYPKANLHIGSAVGAYGSLGSVRRLAIHPYDETGGLWYVASRSSATSPHSEFLDIGYGNQDPSLDMASGISLSYGQGYVNVGIGTTTPQYNLDVVGDVSARYAYLNAVVASNSIYGDIMATNRIDVYSDAFCGTLTLTSSRRYKHNVVPILDALDTISNLQGVSYVWDQAHGGKPDIGFIAEDVARVLPELVRWEDNGRDAKGLDYSHLTALIVEGVKEQQAVVIEHENRIEALETENADLRTRLERLERLFAK